MDGTREDARLLAEAVAETRASFVGAVRDGDAAAAAAVYAEYATLLAPSAEPLKGREAIAAFWTAGVEAGLWDVELEAFELERDTDLAYEIGRYALRLKPPDGQVVVDRGSYVLVHARQADGCWRWVVEMFNPDAPRRAAGHA